MFYDGSNRAENRSRMVVFSADVDFIQTARSAFDTKVIRGFSIIENGLNGPATERATSDAAVVVVDVGSLEKRDKQLSELQHLMTRNGRDVPIVAVVDEFDEIIGRQLVQMRVADILVKPVAAIELLRTCTRLARTKSEESHIHTFLPVAGGVGATTLAIQSALTLLGGKGREGPSTCLVDLNFRQGACADYLDIEARLNLKELELNPERLDRQLLEGMLSYHSSGLAVIAAPNLPTEAASIEPDIIMGLLNVVCQSFDHIVVDMPKAWHLWTDNVLLGSNRLFLVGEATVPGLRKAKQLVENLSDRLGQRPWPKVIVNRFERRLFNPGLRHSDIARSLGDAFAGTVPYNHRLVREAIDRGVPLDAVRKNSDVAAAIKRLIIPRKPRKSNFLFQAFAPSSVAPLASRGNA
jgi:pilus assembly protein CpaE